MSVSSYPENHVFDHLNIFSANLEWTPTLSAEKSLLLLRVFGRELAEIVVAFESVSLV